MTEPEVSQSDSASKPEPVIVNSSPSITVNVRLLMLETSGVLPAAIPLFGRVTQVSESYVTSKPAESHSVSEPPMLTAITCPDAKPVPEAVTTVPPCQETFKSKDLHVRSHLTIFLWKNILSTFKY